MHNLFFIVLIISSRLHYSAPEEIHFLSKRSLDAYKSEDKAHNGFYEGSFIELMREKYSGKFNKPELSIKDFELDDKGQLNVKDLLKEFKNGNKKGGYNMAIKYLVNIVKNNADNDLKVESFKHLATASYLRKTLSGSSPNNAHENMQKIFNNAAASIYKSFEEHEDDYKDAAIESLGASLDEITPDNIQEAIRTAVKFDDAENQSQFEERLDTKFKNLNRCGKNGTLRRTTKKGIKKPKNKN
jgi:hypothetical protein